MKKISEKMKLSAAEAAFNEAAARWEQRHKQGLRTDCVIDQSDIYHGLNECDLGTSDSAALQIDQTLSKAGFYTKANIAHEKYDRLFKQRLADVSLPPAARQKVAVVLNDLLRKITLSVSGECVFTEDEQKVLLSALALNAEPVALFG